MTTPLEPIPNWSDDEKPSMPGSPSTPRHSGPVRVAYIATALLLGITGGLGNALISANLPSIQGELGLTPIEAAWLPAAYLMVNVSTSLLLFKFRQQFGLRLFARQPDVAQHVVIQPGKPLPLPPQRDPVENLRPETLPRLQRTAGQGRGMIHFTLLFVMCLSGSISSLDGICRIMQNKGNE